MNSSIQNVCKTQYNNSTYKKDYYIYYKCIKRGLIKLRSVSTNRTLGCVKLFCCADVSMFIFIILYLLSLLFLYYYDLLVCSIIIVIFV